MDANLEGKNLEIKLEATGILFKWGCNCCGEIQPEDGMRSWIIVPPSSGSEESRIYKICRSCLDAGLEGAIRRYYGPNLTEEKILKYADRDKIVSVLRRVTNWKTGAEYDAVYEEGLREFYKGIKMMLGKKEYEEICSEGSWDVPIPVMPD
jgi:hypothetical protein